MTADIDELPALPTAPEPSRKVLLLLLTLALVLASIWGFFAVRSAQATQREDAFDARTSEVFDLLTEEFGTYEELIQSLDSFYAASNSVERDEFTAFVAGGLSRHPGVKAVSWIPRVYAAERSAMEAAAQDDGLIDFQFKRWRPGEKWQSIEKHWAPEYYPVFYLEPSEGNERAMGIDLWSSPLRRAALVKARNTGRATATGRLLLAQAGGEPGYLLVVPIYNHALPLQTAEDRKQQLLGFVSGVFHIKTLVESSLGRVADQHGVTLRITDESDDSDDVLLYAGSLVGEHDDVEQHEVEMVRSHMQDIGGRTWRFEFSGDEHFVVGLSKSLAWLVLLGGLLLAGITYLLTSRTIDQTRRVEDLVARRTVELEKASGALEASNVELQQFAYIASHDLQAPLRGIAGFTEFLQQDYKGKLDDRADEYIGHIVTGVHRMQTMIDDLLALSRADSQIKAFVQVDMNAVVDDVIGILRQPIEEAQAKVTRDDLPMVIGDRALLAQLLQNLIANGIKFHGDDHPRVHISASDTSDAWHFSIQDNGIGIDPKHADKIFEVFRRLHTRREFPGTGIGLAVCRRIVNRHDGSIGVRPNPDQGSTFYFTLSNGYATTS